MEVVAEVCMSKSYQQLDPTTTYQDTSFWISKDDDQKTLLRLG